MAKTKRGRKIVTVRLYMRKVRSQIQRVRRHRRSTPN